MIGLGILSGFMLFFIVEKLIRMSGSGSGHAHSHDHKKSDDVPDTVTKKGLGPGGILNLAADSMHNFTDGIAIGASFARDERVGVAMVLSVLVHELPHEIGDFAILVQNGASPNQVTRHAALQAGVVPSHSTCFRLGSGLPFKKFTPPRIRLSFCSSARLCSHSLAQLSGCYLTILRKCRRFSSRSSPAALCTWPR